MTIHIKVTGLHKYFGQTKAVDNVSFEFSAGHVYGFIGPNGAGKTTTMRILATLDEPMAGDALICGNSVVQDPELARQNVGFMPDSLPAHTDISVHEYIDFFARSYGLVGKKRKRMVEEVEDFTGLNNMLHKMLASLSKGMKQRVSLARSIVHNPPVLILDEPAAGLDPRARVELRELLKALAAQGKAILISSHILTELAEIIDGAIIIERGKILRAGSLEEISRKAVPYQVVIIRSIDQKHEDIYKRVLELPGIKAAQLNGQSVQVGIEGNDELCCELLTTLVTEGFRIAEFHHEKANLEQVFMNVTKGDLQ